MEDAARPPARRMIPGALLLLPFLFLTGCEITGVEYLPPEALRPAPHAASPPPVAAPATAQASPSPAGTVAVELQAACGNCHGLETLERSSARGAGWAGFLEEHRAGGFISPDAREKAVLLERLRSVYP